MSGKELSLYDAFLAVFKAFLFKTTGSDFMLIAGYTLLKIGSKHLKYIALQFGAFSDTFEGDEEKQNSGQVCEGKTARNGGKTSKFWIVGSAPSASF